MFVYLFVSDFDAHYYISIILIVNIPFKTTFLLDSQTDFAQKIFGKRELYLYSEIMFYIRVYATSKCFIAIYL